MSTETTRVFTRQELADLMLPSRALAECEIVADTEIDERRVLAMLALEGVK